MLQGFFGWLRQRTADAIVGGVEDAVGRINAADAGPAPLQLTLRVAAPELPTPAPPEAAANGHHARAARAAKGR